jgi:hypothetical protein
MDRLQLRIANRKHKHRLAEAPTQITAAGNLPTQ